MNFLFALLVWLVMGAVLGLGLLLASKGTYWLLVLAFLGFFFAIGKIGCATDH